MKVKEMIKMLESFPEDMEVLISASENISWATNVIIEKRGEELSYTKTGYHPLEEDNENNIEKAVMIEGD